MARGLTDDDHDLIVTLLAVSTVLSQELDRRLRADHDLTQFEYGTLAMLGDRCGGMPMGDLAQGLNASASRLSHAVDRLVARGLISRVPATDDRRSVLAVLEPSGATLLAEATPTFEALAGELVLDRLDPPDRAGFLTGLRGIASGLCASHRPDAGDTLDP
jgi:DNA-binding MarR family transcriptional regulator